MADVAWAKSWPRGGPLEKWLPLSVHLADAEAAMGFLLSEWVGKSLDVIIDKQFPASLPGSVSAQERFNAICRFCAAVHDLGKMTPPFQVKVADLAQTFCEQSQLTIPEFNKQHAERAFHTITGAAIIQEYGEKVNSPVLGVLASIVGGHHGFPLSGRELRDIKGNTELLGGDDWRRAQFAIVEDALSRTRVLDVVPATTEWQQPFLVQVQALVEIADWLASDEQHFGLFPLDSRMNSQARRERTAQAMRKMPLPKPWSARDDELSATEMLVGRCGLPADARPTAAQEELLRQARLSERGGCLLILEDTTGSGKTEAAFLAAEILAARNGKAGCLVALPTQATTNSMFHRQLDWLTRVMTAYEPDSPYAVSLQHGNKDLEEVTDPLKRQGWKIHDDLMSRVDFTDNPVDMGADVDAHEKPGIAILPWLTSRRRSALADFVCCTIDQVLLAGLQSRFVELRHLGLARKVVILDEVHAYSEYMNVFLTSILRWLGAMGVPVILLSATLSSVQRSQFTAAYAGRSFLEIDQQPGVYPGITRVDAGGVTTTPLASAGREAQVAVYPMKNGITETLQGLLKNGGCALVVRNTVRRAQETFDELSAVFGAEVDLLHSRFTIADRQAKENSLREEFGRPKLGRQRPYRKVLVATQVVEQSLDVDFDVMVTDLAPIDLLIQRMGRVHRHERKERPEAVSEPACYIDCLPEQGAPEELESGSAFVYDPTVLARTGCVIQDFFERRQRFAVPRDVVKAIEDVYSTCPLELPAPWAAVAKAADSRNQAENTIGTAHTFALPKPKRPSKRATLKDWYSLNVVDEKETGYRQRIAVREGQDSVRVILINRDAVSGKLTTLPHLGGNRVDEKVCPATSLARILAKSTVSLPPLFNHPRYAKTVRETLEETGIFPEWQKSSLLAHRPVLVLENQKANIADVFLEYSKERGLQEVCSD